MTVDELRARLRDAHESVSLSDMVREPVCARILMCSVRSLRARRAAEDSPAPTFIGRSVFYRLEDILAYLESRRHKSSGNERQEEASRVIQNLPKYRR